MLQRYSFICIFAVLLSGLQWWAGSMEPVLPQGKPVIAEAEEKDSDFVSLSQSIARRDLLEVLDRLVVHEKYYHSVYGHFTKVLSRVGFQVPQGVSRQYEIRVVNADKSSLLVTAFSEEDGRMMDVASIDQNFRLEANFPLPPPRAQYLKLQAYKQMRALRDAAPGQSVTEEGVFNGYFRYEVRRDSQNRPVSFAVGVKPPVLGVQLESGPQDSMMAGDSETNLQLLTSLMNSPDWDMSAVGQNSDGTVMTSTEEAFLAQQIFHGEMGRYARDLSELAKITHFRFQDRDGEGILYRSIASSAPGSSGTLDSASRKKKSGPSRHSSSSRLIIEPLNP